MQTWFVLERSSFLTPPSSSLRSTVRLKRRAQKKNEVRPLLVRADVKERGIAGQLVAPKGFAFAAALVADEGAVAVAEACFRGAAQTRQRVVRRFNSPVLHRDGHKNPQPVMALGPKREWGPNRNSKGQNETESLVWLLISLPCTTEIQPAQPPRDSRP